MVILMFVEPSLDDMNLNLSKEFVSQGMEPASVGQRA